MADSLPGHFLPLTAESGQEPTLLVDALGSGNPTIPLGTDRSSPTGFAFTFSSCLGEICAGDFVS